MTQPQTSTEPQSLEELIEENAQLRAQRDVAESKIAVLERTYTNFRDRNASLLKQLAAARTQISNLREQRKELSGQLFDLNLAYAKARETDPEVRVRAAK
ncbi:hypothetical protein [Nocardia tengchongensis]|uniref:hypothetical protein n=1 Tax=Nocardia tengchongensis TaxID=2055889 RepID=UPI0036683E24